MDPRAFDEVMTSHYYNTSPLVRSRVRRVQCARMTKPQWALVTTSKQSPSISAAFGVVTLSASLWLWVSVSDALFLRPYLWCLQSRHSVCRTVAVSVRQRCCISQAIPLMPSESSQCLPYCGCECPSAMLYFSGHTFDAFRVVTVSAVLWLWVTASNAVFLRPYFWCLQSPHSVCGTVAVSVRQRRCISQAIPLMPSESSQCLLHCGCEWPPAMLYF
jgi:hypothetical protein